MFSQVVPLSKLYSKPDVPLLSLAITSKVISSFDHVVLIPFTELITGFSLSILSISSVIFNILEALSLIQILFLPFS